MLRFSLLWLLLFMSPSVYSQKADYNWFFGGTGIGLNFGNCGDSVLNSGGGAGTWEGCVSISDEQTGQLLFYSNGLHVFNANHSIMLGGFQAGLSTSITQNVIVKKPGSSSIYYLITADVQGGLSVNPAFPNANGINYAEIDMSHSGGYGEVVSKFNILKDTSNCEKLVAVQHSNGQDIWLIGHEYGNNNFFVFLITAAGINPVPSIYAVGPVILTPQPGVALFKYDTIGELKASPDGTRLAFTTFYNGITALFDFDPATGVISNPVPLTIDGGGYGVSFSPDNSKLYFGTFDTTTTGLPSEGRLIQFDISSGDSSLIQASGTTIYSCTGCGFTSLKIAPTRRILVGHYGSSGTMVGDGYLGVIASPDSAGLACNYTHNGLYLNGQPSSWGLNNAMENPNLCVFTSIQEDPQKEMYLVSPNPFTDQFMISGFSGTQSEITIDLYSAIGQKVFTEVRQLNGEKMITLNHFSDLSSGFYFLGINTLQTRKVIKVLKE